MLNEHPGITGIISCGDRVVEATRQLIEQAAFCARHRTKTTYFTRRRCLPFNKMMVLLLQKTVRSIQAHMVDFFDRLDQAISPVTASAWSQARLKLQHTAFIELNEKAILEVVEGGQTDFQVRRWEGYRLLAVDSSLITLPNEEEIGREFGWAQCRNQQGDCGRYAQGRISVVTDVLNRLATEGLLVPWQVGERRLAVVHLERFGSEDLALMDRGYASYELFARFIARQRAFVCRCALNSFGVVNRLFAENKEGVSAVDWLVPPNGTTGETRQAGLPEKIQVRFVTVRLPQGSLEVLATNLLDGERYPTKDFGWLYHQRWGIETYYGVIKGRLDLENFTGRSREAVRQDFHATVFLSNLETILTRPAHRELTQKGQEHKYPKQVNHAVCFHAIKSRMIDLLLSAQPVESVVRELGKLFLANPVSVRPNRKPPRRKSSAWRSYRYQRNMKKAVF